MTDTNLLQYEEMLQAGMHFGRKRTVFNPRMKDNVYTVRDGICIIDLTKTQEAVTKAAEFLKDKIATGGLVLFVAPTKQSVESIRALADATGMPYVTERWLGGTLTNFKMINSRVKLLVEMEEQKAKGGWEKYTKKEQLELERKLIDMKRNFEGLKKLTRMPDVVVVGSIREGKLAVAESRIMGVSVVAIANTDSNPEGVVHAICVNDRSKKSVDLIVGAIRSVLVQS